MAGCVVEKISGLASASVLEEQQFVSKKIVYVQ